MNVWFERIVMVCLALFFCFLFLEIGLNVSNLLNQEESIFEFDEVHCYNYVPHTVKSMPAFLGESKYLIEINSLGFREEEPVPKYSKRIMVVGDSITFGVGVEKEETFSQQIENLTEFEVLNFGIPSFGTEFEVALVKEFGEELRPDIVLLVFTNINDFYDNGTKTLDSCVDSNTSSVFRFLFVDFVKTNIGKIPLLKKFLVQSGFARNYLPNDVMMLKIDGGGFPEEAWSLKNTENLLKEFKQVSDNLGAVPILVYVPSAAQVNENVLDLFSKTYQEDFNNNRPNIILKAMVERLGLNFVDTTVALRTADDYDMYFYPTGHLTVKGNKVVGKTIIDYVNEVGVLKK